MTTGAITLEFKAALATLDGSTPTKTTTVSYTCSGVIQQTIDLGTSYEFIAGRDNGVVPLFVAIQNVGAQGAYIRIDTGSPSAYAPMYIPAGAFILVPSRFDAENNLVAVWNELQARSASSTTRLKLLVGLA